MQYFVYDRAGRKIAEVSPLNYISGGALTDMTRTTYSYDAMGRVLLVTQIWYDTETSSWKTFVSKANTYDNNGNITKSQDALGYQNNYGTLYEYDKANRVTKMTDPACQALSLDHTMLYTYNALGRVLTQTDANNAATIYTYNDDGKVLTKSVASITLQTNTYDLQGNVLTSTDGNGKVTSYDYNNLNGVRSMTLPGDTNIGSMTTTYKYTKTGKPAEQKNDLNKQQVITYDNQGHVLTTTEKKSDGTQSITISNRYDLAGNLRYKVDGRSNTTQFTYDALNRNLTQTVTVTDVLNNTTTQTTTYTYDANGNKLTELNWCGNTYTYTYDKLGRVTLKTDPYGKTIEKLVYNNNGNQISSTDALNNTTQYAYDRDNRQTQVTDPLNYSKYQYYDGAGNVVRIVDANNNSTYFTFNGLNRLSQVLDALNETTSYTYDANGNMLTQTDGRGNVTTVTYNCRNLPVTRADAGGTVSYAYNCDGTTSAMTDKNGVTTSCTYDIHGRTLSTTAGGVTVSYTYDNNGNTLTMIDATGTTTRTYDQLNRTISKSVSGVTGTSTFQYDVTASMPANCIGEITTDAKNNVNTKIFDRAGRLYQIKVGSATTTYAYFDNGNRSLLTYPNGLTAEYTYYADNRLHTLANKHGSTIINAYNYAYDNNGNMTSKLDISGTTTYTYDALNRLAGVTTPGGKATAYTFDAAGNRATQQVTDGSNITNATYLILNGGSLMSKTMTREQMINKASGMKKMMDFVYKHELAGQKHAKVGVEEFVETRHGKIRILKYGFEDEQIMPLYIDMHGGGFILMHADADETMNIVFNRGAGVKIISIDYPKAPDNPYPISIEAIHDVVAHYVRNAGEYHLDVTKLGIGGHSAGANMATVTCLKDLVAKEFNFKYQVLDYPPLDIATSPYHKPKPKGCIAPKQAMIFNACYIDPEDAMDPFVSPAFAKIEDLKDMPEALIIVCGGDSLHDEGVQYVNMLREAGTKVEFHEYPTERHGFTYFKPSDNVKEAICFIMEFIRANAH